MTRTQPVIYGFTSHDEFIPEDQREMANHKSAQKRMRQTERRNEINRQNRARLRTAIKDLRSALSGGDNESARQLLPKTVSLIDKSVQKGVVHAKAAARYKSRLTSRMNQSSKA